MVNSHEHEALQDRTDSFDVKASIGKITQAVRHHRLLVWTTALLTVAITVVYVYVWPPIYKSSALLMAERDSDLSRDAFYVSWNIFRKDDPRTEIELMKAGPVLKEVVEEERLTYDDVYHPVLSELAYLWQKSPVGKFYKGIKNRFFPDDYGGLLKKEDIEVARVINDLREGISIEPIGESNVGRLTVKGPSRRVAGIANRLMDAYAHQRMQRHYSEAANAFRLLSQETTKADQEVQQIEARRLQFLRQNSLAFDLQKEGLQVTQLSDLEGAMASARTRIAALQATLQEIGRELALEPETRTVSDVTQLNAVRETLKLKRVDLQTALIGARDHYRADSPEVKELEGDITKLDSMLGSESEKVEQASTQGLNAVRTELISKRDTTTAELASLQASMGQMQLTEDELRNRLSQVPGMARTLKDLDRELGAASEKYQALLGKRAQAAVSMTTALTSTPTLSVVEAAAVPAEKYWPKTKILYPAALLVGLFLGVFAAMLKSYSEGVLRREHVMDGHAGLPLYGSVSVPLARGPSLVEKMRSTNRRAAGRIAG